jgi:hypothetical protein
MTDDELEAIRARANAATPGPWEVRELAKGETRSAVCRVQDSSLDVFPVQDIGSSIMADTIGTDEQFIAHAREDVPALVTEILRLRSRLYGHLVVPQEETQ